MTMNPPLAFFGFSAANPLLLWGAALIAAPILIHLLSKRKFRVVEWAAMEFLLDAHRHNRRRIQLEHLLLLLLRCLAIILLSLLVARLFRAGMLFGGAGGGRVERIVVLDNSPSMSGRGESKSAFEDAKDGLAAFLRKVGQEHPGDTLTLLTTAQPERPVVNGQPLTRERIEETARLLTGIEVSDVRANFDRVTRALADLVGEKSGQLERVVYIVTDLRATDWLDDSTAHPDRGVPARLKQIRERTTGLFIVDVGGRRIGNLAITGVVPQDKTLAVGVPARFEVELQNHGESDLHDIEVSFGDRDAVAQRASVGTVKAGAKVAVPFAIVRHAAGPAALVAQTGGDEWPADNTFYYAGQVQEGINLLVVDGKPSAEYAAAETFFLERALRPPGELPSGNKVQVVSETQFDAMTLDSFQAVLLANVYHLAEERRASLEQWVRDGGGLVFFLGDQVDQAHYNDQLWRKGDGLFPLRLDGVRGDEQERQWSHFVVKANNHPALKIFAGLGNPFLQRVKIYRWWHGQSDAGAQPDGRVQVLAGYSGGGEDSPALVEKKLDNGRVMALTTTADGDWNNWPADPSYVVTMLELARHVARPVTGGGQVVAGEPIRQPLDVSRYEAAVKIVPPQEERAVTQRAEPAPNGKGLGLEYTATDRRGFYRLVRQRHDGTPEPLLVAANLDPRESDLRPADLAAVRQRLAPAQVEVVRGVRALAQGAGGTQSELWRGILIALLGVLCAEQFLGWWFGRRR